VLSKKIVVLAVPVAVGALALTACGGKGGHGGSAGAKPTYTIGFQGPLSGENSELGINQDNGLKLAVERANARGNLPFLLKVADSDDQGTPDQAPAAAQKLISDHNVVAVVGPSFSGATKASAAFYAQSNLVIVTPSATNPGLTDASNRFTSFLRGVPNDNVQGHGIAEFLTGKAGAKEVYVVDDTSDYGRGLADVARSELKAAGVRVVNDSVPAGTPDYTTAATKVVHSGADALVYAGYYADAAPFAKKLRSAGFKGIEVAGDATKDDEFVKLAGDASENWYLSCPCTDATKEQSTKNFATAYEKKFHQSAGTYSGESYDITNMIISEMEKLGTGVTREKLLAGLRTVDYKGLTKEFSFGPDGELRAKKVFLYKVQNGTIGYLGDVDTISNPG